MITLFPSSATTFTTNGLGSLNESISCIVTEEKNGEFELELEYPIIGRRYSDLELRRIILAKPNLYDDPQPFRIYNISKPMDGIITVSAHHISYDLTGYPVSPFTGSSISISLANMKIASTLTCPFTFVTNSEVVADLQVIKPVSIRSLLGNEIIGTYGGDYEFDKYAVKHHADRGFNRGVSIRYGKNLLDLKQEENCAAVYTGVYPFWYSEADGLIQLTNKIVNAIGTYDFDRIFPLDLSSSFSEVPTETELRAAANEFMVTNNIGIPKVSIDVSFMQLTQSEEYKDFAILETVKLCDYVNVEFPIMGVSAVAKCIKTIYDVLTKRYENIELGEAKSNIARTIADGFQSASQKIAEINTYFSKEVDTIKIGLADIDFAMVNKVDTEELEAGYAHLVNGYIDLAQIGDATIGHAKIANAAIETANIKVGAITTALLGTAAVDTAQIKDGSITDAKIVDLTANKITAGTIDASEIDVINLHAVNITVGTINGVQITNGAISSTKLGTGAVTTAKIAVGAITVDKIAAGTITGDKLALGTIAAQNLNVTSHMLY